MRGIVFLDRDGTLIEEVGYLSDPRKVSEIPGAAESLLRLSGEGFALAVLSNQAGLAKGKFQEDQMEAVHRAFVELFRAKGVEFAAVEYCPHHPEGSVEKYRAACDCRKPSPGLAQKVLTRTDPGRRRSPRPRQPGLRKRKRRVGKRVPFPPCRRRNNRQRRRKLRLRRQTRRKMREKRSRRNLPRLPRRRFPGRSPARRG